MIDEYWTWMFYGYHSDELSHGSDKPIVARCDMCCKYRILHKKDYRELCVSCTQKGRKHSIETKRKIGDGNTGKYVSDETRQKISSSKKGGHLSEEHKQKISESNKGKIVSKETRLKMSKIHKGRKHTDETKQKISDSHKNRPPVSKETGRKISESLTGRTSPLLGRPISEEHRQKISDANQGENNGFYGKHHSKKTRRQISATKRCIAYDEWESFAKEYSYCPKFNEKCRESNREKYGRKCFLCGKNEEENGTKLSVHHVDMNREQGCGYEWKLVPLCASCHGKAHSKQWKSRIEYLLRNDVITY